MDTEDFLAHHGVKGMHWGVRKSRPDRVKPASSSEHVETREIRKKPVHTLTNHDLKKFNERVQMEKKYRELKPNTYPTARVSEFIKGALAVTATVGSIYAVSQTPHGKRMISLAKKWLKIKPANALF